MLNGLICRSSLGFFTCLVAQSLFANDWKQIDKWYIEAESRAIAFGSNKPEGILSHRILVMTSADQLAYFVGHPDLERQIDWQHEPFHLDLKILDGNLIKHNRFNRVVEYAELPHGRVIPNPVGTDILFFFMPTWILPSYPPPQATDQSMVFVVDSALAIGQYTLVADDVEIAGERCQHYQSQSGQDLIWVSQNKEGCLIKRVWFAGVKHSIKSILETKHTLEIAPDLWIPSIVDVTHQRKQESAYVTVNKTQTKIISSGIGDQVPLELLELDLKPGTIERTAAGSEIQQIIPGGKELMMEISEFCREKFDLPAKRKRTLVWKQRALQIVVGICGGLLLGTFVVARYRNLVAHQSLAQVRQLLT